MKSLLLLDLDHGKKKRHRLNLCSVASQISIFKGLNNIGEKEISEKWTFEGYPPSIWQIKRYISVKNVKWYIKNFIEINDPIWNSDFIAGLRQNGNFKEAETSFPTFIWKNNKTIENIIKTAPFYGKLIISTKKQGLNHWSHVPAFCLRYSDKSISFMAGVLSSGELSIHDDISYIKYTQKIKEILQAWRIPIEKEDSRSIYISPFWTALLVPWMPKCCDPLTNVRHPCMAKEYALVSWRIFTGSDIKTKAIPFLVSRRTFFYKYESIKDLERDWIKYKLVELDERFKQVVRIWRDKSV